MCVCVCVCVHLFGTFEVLTARMHMTQKLQKLFFKFVPKPFYQTTRRRVTKDSSPCTHYRKNAVAQITGLLRIKTHQN